MISLWIISEIIQFFLRVAPVFIDLYKGLKVDFLVKEALKAFACLGGNLLQGHSLMADDNAFLTVALHVYDGIDVDLLCLFFETLHDHLNGIGDFLIVITQDFLTNYLRYEKFRRLVGQLILIEIGRTFGQ